MNDQLHGSHRSEHPEHPDKLAEHIAERHERAELGDRLLGRIADGIASAKAEHREIDDGTARRIGRALGHAVGPDSALTTFGGAGEVSYETLRDEYLDLYNDDSTPSEAREWIDWLGTHLVMRLNGDVERLTPDDLPPKLARLLAPTSVTVNGRAFTVNVPATYGQAAIDDLAPTLTELVLDEDPALQAFLTLPDVSAASGNIMEEFHEHYVGTFAGFEEAVDDLVEIDALMREVEDFASDRDLYVENIAPDYEALLERAREAYDVVERNGRVYAFHK